jgi:hypothetical protein
MTSLFHLDSTRRSLILQDHRDRIDDADLRVRLAMHDGTVTVVMVVPFQACKDLACPL